MSRPKPPKVTTITVGTNEREWLETCFDSLLASDTAGVELAVTYVDNASADGSPDFVAERFPHVTVTRNATNLGFSRANNVGMKWALDEGTDYVLLVNPDTRTPTTLLRELVEFMAAHPHYGIVGPMQHTYDAAADGLGSYNEWSQLVLKTGERHAFSADWPNHPSHAGPPDGRAPNTLEHAYVQGSALFVRAEVLRTVGVFDEVFHTYYEEVDLCRRARWAGWRVALLLNLGIQHKGGGGAGHGRYRRVQMRRNRYYYLFTDVDWAPVNALRLAGRWLKKDLRGRSVGGHTSPVRGMLETGTAVGWLICRLPQIIERRHRHRQLAIRRPATTGVPSKTADLA